MLLMIISHHLQHLLLPQIPDIGIDPLSYLSRNPHSFVYFEVDSAKVKKQILSFKSKPSNNKSIPSFAYKCTADVLSPVLAKLTKIDKWVCANKLSLNINKTTFSICSTKSVTDVLRNKIRNVELYLVNNLKFLGISIDSNLSFSSHYRNVCNKTSRSSSVLSKLAYYVPQPILRNNDLSTLRLWH